MTLNGSLVNVDASHYSGSAFSSNMDPRTVNVNVMPEPASNIQAAASYIPCKTGGSRKKHSINLHKINKISRMYKMKGNKKSAKRMKSRLRSKYSANSRSRYATRRRSRSQKRSKSHRRSMGQKGGYAQYQNNMPMTQTYSTGGPLSPSLSAMATPPTYHVLSNCTNCIDNFSKVENAGFPSKGWH